MISRWLKIDATGLTAAKVGDSSTLRVGDYTIVIGNPLGELQGTVTTGIISALEREIDLDGTTYTVLQTNAAVNPGNSGGGMFDFNGDLIEL
jgi:serine protease Do